VSPGEPPFALRGPRGTLVADGVRTRYSDVQAAQAALRSTSASIVLNALPFDVGAPADPADSDDEVDETTTKFATVLNTLLNALGVVQ
jgi:isochorismate synthase EntC